MTTDYDFVDTYRMSVLAGRGFSRDFSTDSAGAMMLNEAAVARIGWTPMEAVGKELVWGRGATGKIVGVIKNFNFRSVRTEIEPLVLTLSPDYITSISVRILPDDLEKTLDFIKQKWTDTFPGELFEQTFLDDRINQLYESEMKMQKIFIVFSILSIFIACMGLFGLAAFTAESRTKEIGIRKVLGASTVSAIMLLSKEFIKWIILANIVAWPLAWFIMNRWLQNFAFKANIGWIVYLFAFAITTIIAFSTFSFQAIKAARANPVDSIKHG